MSGQILVDQPNRKPVRKVRVAGYVTAGLTVVTYLVTAVQGEAVVSQEAFLNALGVLTAGLVPVVSAYLAKEEA